MEIHATDPLLLEPSPFEVEISVEKLKMYKSLGSDHIPSEMIHAKMESHVLMSIKCLSSGTSLLVCFIYKKGNKADCCNYRDMIVVKEPA
jgi:hypothetical protein